MARRKKAATGKRYDEKFKAGAVVMLESQGYPDNVYKLQEVADHLGVPSRTLRRWWVGDKGAPAGESVQQEKRELADLFEDAARTYLRHAVQDDVVDEVSGNASMTAAAIAVDKMQLLRGLPTEIVSMIPDVVRALKAAGYDPAQVFNDLIAEAARDKAQLDAEDAGQAVPQ